MKRTNCISLINLENNRLNSIKMKKSLVEMKLWDVVVVDVEVLHLLPITHLQMLLVLRLLPTWIKEVC